MMNGGYHSRRQRKAAAESDVQINQSKCVCAPGSSPPLLALAMPAGDRRAPPPVGARARTCFGEDPLDPECHHTILV